MTVVMVMTVVMAVVMVMVVATGNDDGKVGTWRRLTKCFARILCCCCV